MSRIIACALVVVFLLGVVVDKGESFIRAGREEIMDNRRSTKRFQANHNDKVRELKRSQRYFKKGRYNKPGGIINVPKMTFF